MGPSTRPDYHINLSNLGPVPQLGAGQSRSESSTAATSPIEPPPGLAPKYPIGTSNALGGGSNPLRAGSPSKEYTSRLFSKRAREIQAQEGISMPVWTGPPTSGHSTPLRETIPESPNGESFPAFDTQSNDTLAAPTNGGVRRGRAGTVPSKFSPGEANNAASAPSSVFSRSSRVTPSASPFGSSTPTGQGSAFGLPLASNSNSGLLARLRSGSTPQQSGTRSSLAASPFGSTLFSSSWDTGRNRASTLASIQSSDAPLSPAHSHFSRDSLGDGEIKTLDYLGLVDPPQHSMSYGDEFLNSSRSRAISTLQPAAIAELAQFNEMNRNANRFRSFSVNAKEKLAADDLPSDDGASDPYYSGTMTPEALAIHEAVRQHNLEVQAFANLASASRPRARTAGVLDAPSSRMMRAYVPSPSRLGDNSLTASDLLSDVRPDFSTLADSLTGLNLNGDATAATSHEEGVLEGPSRALWLGNIPSSTTISSLSVIFSNFGPIESTRVLTHKNCGFVNFENTDNAVQAKAQLNGKEIFPGAGPIRIGFAKAPSNTGTPRTGGGAPMPSQSPDPGRKGSADASSGNVTAETAGSQTSSINAKTAPAALATPDLQGLRGEIMEIVRDFGAGDDDSTRVAALVDHAFNNDHYHAEIPSVPEPSPNRIHDAPRLRDIRKRIDNHAYTQTEIEAIAMEMLPEIAELSSDYLGNTVVQKLFEYCSESVKESMLQEIAPHLAEIGVHKNGTWAAQKIIDVARTPQQMQMIVDALRPYSVASFLDQYGNYVMQCCLRFANPMNDFIFESMIGRLWEISQGRFGARAMRACLESHYASKDQQRMMAAAIALHSVQLATNANGALLLTWFLDTCTFPRRRSVLAPRLVPHLVHLCTHKVAYLTVLKIINQRNEPEARDTILQALFFSQNDQILQDILSDQSCGATLIFKVLTTPFFDEKIRQDVVQNVRNVLVRLKAQPAQGYKRLMDEVGLPTRQNVVGGGAGGNGNGAREDSNRPSSKHVSPGGAVQNPAANPPFQPQFMPPHMQGSPFDGPPMNLTRSTSFDQTSQDSFSGLNGMNAQAFAGNANLPMQAMSPQQLQYQQAMMAASNGRGNPNVPPPQFPTMNGMGAFAPMGNPQLDPLRGAVNTGSPQPMMQSGFQQPAYTMPQNMYQYNMGYGPMQQQQVVAGQRRRR